MPDSNPSIVLNRREFLGRSVPAVAGAALGLNLLLDATAEAASDLAWQELARSISGPVLRPGDSEFATLAQPFNLVTEGIIPEGIARCSNAKDVSQAVVWARKHEVPLVARSGGHSAGGYSVTRGLMIDTKLMNHARFDPDTGTVTIGGGILNGGVYQALQQNGVTITHGRCPYVGAAGFLLGGGVGFNIRSLGVGVDALVASQIVTVCGDIHTLSDTHYSDLFWACRGGGGGNFGINTSFTLRTFPVPASVTAAQVAWSTGVDEVFPTLMQALYASPTNLGTWTTLSGVTPEQFASGKDVSVFFEGQLLGTPAELDGIISPAYAVAQPSMSTVREMGYWDAQLNVFSDTPSASDLQNCTLYFRGPVNPAACAVVLKWLRQWPGTSIFANLSFLRTGGQANQVPSDATAFVHRNNDWLLVFYLKWNRNVDSEATINANLAWLSAFYNELAAFGIGEAYQNFLDPSLDDFLVQYYGSNLGRLRRLKGEYDPKSVYRFPQGIPPAFAQDSWDRFDLNEMMADDSAARRPAVARRLARQERRPAARRDAVHGSERSRSATAQGSHPTGGHHPDKKGDPQGSHPTGGHHPDKKGDPRGGHSAGGPQRDQSGGRSNQSDGGKHHGH
jgi:FAD/FMN-containing dehydrogenase